MERQAGFRSVLAVREFRALWAAELLSVVGDQLARVGLAVLVFRETNSAGWTALAYALTYLPALLGSVLLGGLADRYPRRELIVVVDLLRAGIAGLMAIPVLPLPVLFALVFALTLAGAPFKAAQQALLPTILTGDKYVTGLALRTVTNQSAQVAGFLAGGALLLLLDPHVSLGLNGVTFAIAALVVLAGVTHRPAARRDVHVRRGAARLIARDPNLLGLVALSWLVGVFAVPEGLAAPYGATFGGAAIVVGVLMASVPVGSIAGAWLVAKVPRSARPAATLWFAVGAGLPLAACLLQPPLAVVAALWALSGAATTAYLVLAQAAFVLGVPDHSRGAASGLAGAGVLSSQGIAVLGAGILADATSPVFAVGAGGVTGALLALTVGVPWLRSRGHSAHKADVTSPTTSSELPPPMGNLDAYGEEVLTNPMTASRVPPSTSSAAEHGNGHGDVTSGVTNPTTASLVPPSNGVAAEHGNGSTDQVSVARSHKSASLSADERSRRPSRWALWREPRRLLVLILLVEAITGCLTGFLVLRSQVTATDLVTLGIIVGLGVSMGEMTRHVERVRRRFNDTPHVNLTSVWTFAAVLSLPPVLAPAVIGTLYLHLFWRSWYRVRSVHAYRLVFTASTVMLSAYSASTLRHWLAPADLADWDNPMAMLAVVIAALAYAGVNWGLIVVAITLHERRLSMRKAFGTGREAALEFGTIGLGAITALLVSFHPGWALMIVPALLVLHRSVLMRQLEEAASTDQKTGLSNATSWTNLATAEVQRATRDGTQIGVLMIDLDHFKAVNDAHGHLVGDRVLQAVADTLSSSSRRYDIVGRWGGEEFVVLCPEIDAEGLHQLGERVCERVRELRVPVSENQVVEGLSVSVGVALFPEFGPDLQDVLLAADDALFVAKDSGRNQVQTIVAAIGDLNGHGKTR
jgi:diguanylate cyclase (GGDEF)-like protein